MALALESLVDAGAGVQCLGSGFQVTEGPVWVGSEQGLYFHDIPGDTRWRWTEQRGLEVAAQPTFKANGMCLDIRGDLLVCEQVTSCLVRFPVGGGPRELLAFHHGGRYLNSPNDVVVRGADGGIYFTDPDFGRWNDWIGQTRTRDELGFRGVYRLADGGGEVELLVDEREFDQPNGLCFSPDESLLYVNDSPRRHVKVFEVRADGSLGDARVLIDGIGPMLDPDKVVVDARTRPPAPDGMECDELGNVWVTGPGGIWIVSPEGERIGVLEVPESCKSLTWGGGDMRSLFLTSTSTLHVARTLVRAAPVPPEQRS